MSVINFVDSKTNGVFFQEDVARYFINSLKYRPMRKFGYKQASIVDWHTAYGFEFEDPFTGELLPFMVTALKSYNTMVACMISVVLSDEKTHYFFIEWHGYSQTTSKQVTQWRSQCLRDYSHGVTFVQFGINWD